MRGVGADGPYWTALKAGRLDLPQCPTCKSWRWPAPYRCAECGGWWFDWRSVALTGRIYSWTRTWHRFAGTENLDLPYVTVSIELLQAGGVRLFGLLATSDAPAIGAAVSGEIMENVVFDRAIPAIRWSLAS